MASDKRVFKPKPHRLKCLVFSISKRTHVEFQVGEHTIMWFILHTTQTLKSLSAAAAAVSQRTAVSLTLAGTRG